MNRHHQGRIAVDRSTLAAAIEDAPEFAVAPFDAAGTAGIIDGGFGRIVVPSPMTAAVAIARAWNAVNAWRKCRDGASALVVVQGAGDAFALRRGGVETVTAFSYANRRAETGHGLVVVAGMADLQKPLLAPIIECPDEIRLLLVDPDERRMQTTAD